MASTRTMKRAVRSGMTRTVGGFCWSGGGSSGTPTAGVVPAARGDSCLHGAQQVGPQARDAEHARARVRADHRPDLRQQIRVTAVDLAPALGQALGLGGGLDVLDGERVAAVLPALLEVRDET